MGKSHESSHFSKLLKGNFVNVQYITIVWLLGFEHMSSTKGIWILNAIGSQKLERKLL
jgi:hypothetical protein